MHSDSLPDAEFAFVADYSIEVGLADDPEALLDHLDILLAQGRLEPETRARIIAAIEQIPAINDERLLARARLASVMVMSAPDYLVQR